MSYRPNLIFSTVVGEVKVACFQKFLHFNQILSLHQTIFALSILCDLCHFTLCTSWWFSSISYAQYVNFSIVTSWFMPYSALTSLFLWWHSLLSLQKFRNFMLGYIFTKFPSNLIITLFHLTKVFYIAFFFFKDDPYKSILYAISINSSVLNSISISFNKHQQMSSTQSINILQNFCNRNWILLLPDWITSHWLHSNKGKLPHSSRIKFCFA